jgi:hypothetical protein
LREKMLQLKILKHCRWGRIHVRCVKETKPTDLHRPSQALGLNEDQRREILDLQPA